MRTTNLFLTLFALLAVGFGFAACNDDDTVDYTKYYDWRDENNAVTLSFDNAQRTDSANTYFNNRAFDLKEPQSYPVYFHFVHRANLDSLRALNPRKDFRPYSTSKVSVHYTLFKTKSVYKKMEELMMVSSKPYDEAMKDLLSNTGGAVDSIFFANAADNTLKADTLESYQVRLYEGFTPNSVINGWGTLLQQMYIGDHVVCMIPWFLAYGQAGSGANIDPYTNLFFRIELCDIPSLGQNIPDK